MVTINGSGFTNAESVQFGNLPVVAFSVTNDNEITATVPPGITGAVDVIVTVPLGTSPTSSSDWFVYAQIYAMGPTSGPQGGGTIVTLNGSGFSALTLEAVTFGGVAGSGVTLVDDGTITVTTPAGPANTSVPVSVITSAGTVPFPNGMTFYYAITKQKEKEKDKDFKDTKEKDTKEGKDTKEKKDTKESVKEFAKELERKGVALEKVTVLDLPRLVYRPAPATGPSRSAATDRQTDASGAPVEPKPPETTLARDSATEEAADVAPKDVRSEPAGRPFISKDERPAVGVEADEQEKEE